MVPSGALDARQFPRRPVAGDLAELHPEQMVEARVQAAHDFLEDLEAEFLAVEVDAGPVGEHDGRLAAADDVDHAAALQSAVMNLSTPPGGVLSQPPVQSPVQPMMLHDAARVAAVRGRWRIRTRGATLCVALGRKGARK